MNATFIEAKASTDSNIQFVTGATALGNFDGVARMTIRQNGDIGIGTNSPGGRFAIADIDLYQDIINWPSGGIKKITDQHGIIMKADSSMLLQAGEVHDYADLGIASTTTNETLYLLADSAIRFKSGTQSGYLSGSDMVFTAAGRLGIGDVSPDALLDVAGSFRLDGTFADKDGDVGTAGQILSSTNTGTDWISNKQTTQFSGRAYLYTDNRWTTWSNTAYGPNYYQWSSNCGTAVDPNCSWAALGLWLPKGTLITGITVMGRANNTQVTDVEQSWEFRYPNPTSRYETGIDNNLEDIQDQIYRNFWWNNTTPGQPAFTGNTNDMHKRHYEVNYVTPEDGYVDQIYKPVGALSSNRYFYGVTTIEYVLPADL